MSDTLEEKADLLDIDQVCEALALGRRTVERLAAKLGIQRRKFRGGRKLYYSREDVMRMDEELRRQNPTVTRVAPKSRRQPNLKSTLAA